MIAAIDEYHAQQDDVLRFVFSNQNSLNHKRIERKDVFTMYEKWCKSEDILPKGKKNFYKEFGKFDFVKSKVISGIDFYECVFQSQTKICTA